jgi:hypothetical protein
LINTDNVPVSQVLVVVFHHCPRGAETLRPRRGRTAPGSAQRAHREI